MKNKKTLTKIGGLALSAMLFTGALTGCGTPSSSEGQLKIGIVQIMEHTSLNEIRTSFVQELEKQGYKDGQNIQIDYQNAQSDQSNLNQICSKFVGDKKDLIVAIATPSAQAAAAATSDIPIVFSAVEDPVGSKLMNDMAKPNGNITGTSDSIPVDKTFDLMKQLTPNVKKVGLIFNSGETNSVSANEKVSKYCQENGLEIVTAPVTNTSETQQAFQSLIGKVDAVYSPTDNTVASAMKNLAGMAREAKLPFYTGADSMVKDGGFACTGVNYTALGQETAKMAAQVLQGTPITEIPARTMSEFKTVINENTLQALNVTIPDSLKATVEMLNDANSSN